MRILIATAKFGMGHVKVAHAIEEELKDLGYDHVDVVDLLELVLEENADLFYKGYDAFVNHGGPIFNFYYDRSNETEGDFVAKLLSDTVFRIFKHLIRFNNPDVYIATHPTCAQLMSYYKRRYNSDIPLVTWITDTHPHSFYINPYTNFYVGPNERTKEALLESGISEDSIYIGGIPVSKNFREDFIKIENTRKQLLVMGGGLGILPKEDAFYEGLETLDCDVTVVTGKNKTLKEKLDKKRYNINVLGFVNNVEKYMQSADLLISKSGGITTYEAIYSEVPLLIFKPFLAQEISNAEYIDDKNFGRMLNNTLDKAYRDIPLIKKIVEDDSLIYTMRENIIKEKQSINDKALEEILDKLEKN